MGARDLRDKITEAENVGVCIKSSSHEVLYQNDACEAACGKRVSQKCSDGCMRLYEQQSENRSSIGSQAYPSVKIGEKFFDIVLIDDGENLFTLLVDLSKKQQGDLEYFSNFGLTQRETEILRLVLECKSNKEISKKLFISMPTLRTHLKNIYRKVPNQSITNARKGSPEN